MADIPDDIVKTVYRVISDLKGRADSIEEDAEAVLADAFSRAILAERDRLYPVLKECREYVRFAGGENGFLFRDINVALGEA